MIYFVSFLDLLVIFGAVTSITLGHIPFGLILIVVCIVLNAIFLCAKNLRKHYNYLVIELLLFLVLVFTADFSDSINNVVSFLVLFLILVCSVVLIYISSSLKWYTKYLHLMSSATLFMSSEEADKMRSEIYNEFNSFQRWLFKRMKGR